MNKTINHIFLSMLLTAIAATVASCTDELDLPADSSDIILLPGDYRFIIGHDDEPPMSRVEYTDEKSSRFETGDRIGVFATNSEKQIQNDVFSARDLNGTSVQVLAPPKGTVTQGLDTVIPTGENIHYIFYHPMNETWKLSDVTQGTGLSYSVEPDQSTKEAYEHSDFLWNYLASKPEEPIQVIKMHHLMANIIVRIHRDSIDNSNEADNGVTLKNIHTSASNIQLTKQLNHEMNYHVAANGTVSDIKMYCQGESGEYLIYRAAVPAWQTLAEGSGIISVNLFNRAGNTEKVTYTLAAPLSLRDGYYYTFTLRSAVKPAVPEVSDDDSWVLDVFDPETNEIVGLLCREYIRYQPEHTGANNTELMDELTGTPYNDTRYISSQAWVYYELKETERKIPDLNHGTVLRFLYDIRANFNGGMHPETASAWPAPHTYGVSNWDSAQGIFLVNHGHTWVKGPEHGQSSDDWTENYMHGGSITWEATANTEGESYYHISEFKMPSQKITNEMARDYGHIAIKPDGSTGVSYATFTEESDYDKITYDSENNKVAYVREHFFVDLQDSRNIKYPIVKIGYNNFWMSKALRRNNQSNLNLTRLNDENEPFKEFTNIKEILPAGYLYPFNKKYNFSVFRDSPNREDFPLLYNYNAIANPDFVPASTGDIVPEDRFICYLPESIHVNRILSYFGWKFAAKLMTSEVRTTTATSLYAESEIEALMKNKIIASNYNLFAANVSGFNLRTNGHHGYNHGMGEGLGFECGFWVNNNYYTQNPGCMKTMSLKSYEVFSTSTFNALFDEQKANDISDVSKSAHFYSVRFTMVMKGQENSDPIMPISSTIKSLSRSASAQPADKPESIVISVPVIESKD